MAKVIGAMGLLVLLPVLGGCGFALLFWPDIPEGGSVKVTPGAEGYLVTGAPLHYSQRDLRDIRVPHIILTECFPGHTWTCVPIRVTENPSDDEFWQFEARVKIRSGFRIPYGRRPVDYLIVGSESQCEETRTLLSVKGTPTERCQGPHHFKRVDSQ